MSAASDRKKATTAKTAAKTTTTAAGNNTKKTLQSGYKGTSTTTKSTGTTTSAKSTGTTTSAKSTGSSMAGNSYSAALSNANKTGSTGSTGNGNSYAAGYNENRLLQSGNKNTGGTTSGGISIPTSAATGGSYGTTGGSYGTTGGSYGGYDNGGLTADQIKQLQAYYGTDTDGLWGANSTASAGGLSAQEAWQQYRQDLQRQQEMLDAQLYGDTISEGMSWEQYLDKMGATDYQTKLQEAISAQVQQAVDDYNRQIEETGTNYEEAARRAYINNMLSRRNMDQEMAASGVYGGMADSQRIAMEADYQNNLTDLETQYADTISQLEQAATNARLSGDAQVAEQMAAYLSQVQGQYSNYLSQLQQERAAAALAAQQAQAQRALLAQENSYSTPSYYSSGSGSSGGSSYSGGSGGADASGSASGDSGAGVSNYAGVKNNILLYASRGMNSVANRLINQSWSEMNEAQQNDLVATMRQKGYIS